MADSAVAGSVSAAPPPPPPPKAVGAIMADDVGMRLIIGGKVQDKRSKTSADNKSVSVTFTLAWFGDNQYLQLEYLSQADFFDDGDDVIVECGVRKFKDTMYPSRARLISVNGKPVKGA